ncbi:hypothetical protein FRC03_012536 [Tulasnella sp. 419]|nr:hypothetical protein FRC03_012536 [Tulasnella sp. 419]
MIWNKDKKVLIVPSLVLLLIICTGVPSTIAECLLFYQPSPRASRLFQTLLPIGWTTALVNNFVCTLLIVWKLWRIARTAEGQSTAKLANPAITAFIESGALYTSTIFCMIVLMAAKMRGATCLVVVILPVIIGIAPTSIVLRLNLAAVRMSSRSVQNDGLFLPWAPSGERFHGEQKYQQSYVSIGVETIPEAVFAKRSGFTSNMISVDVSVESGYQSSTAPNQ